jgi:hypothetical protein
VTSHLVEEALVLLHYGEDDELAAGQRAHLESCEACRAELGRLRRMLEAVELPVPERGADYGARLWERLRFRLPRRRRLGPRLALGGAIAASLVAAFLAGRHTAPTPVAFSAPVRERILLVAVSDHLERSGMVLAELVHAPADGSADLSSERQSAQALAADNRLYRQTALRSGDQALAGVLDDLGRVLLEVANGPAEPTAARLRELQERIESQGIRFKVRVVGQKVRARVRQGATERGATES